MPVAAFESYLRVALKAHGVNPDAGDVLTGGPPPSEDHPFELSEELKALLAEHDVVPVEVA